MTPEQQECPHEDEAVLFGLHALDPEQEAVVAQHVRSCAACLLIVREVEQTFAEVGATAATAPSARLRQRVMDTTYEQEHPGVIRLDSRRTARTRSPQRQAPRRGRRLAVVLAAAVVVLGIAGGGIVWSQFAQQRNAATVHAATVDDVLATIARSPHSVLVDRSGHPVAAVVLDARPRFYAIDLAPPAADRMWVLWGARGSTSTALATVPAGRDGGTTAVAPGRPGEYEAYLLTQESIGPLPSRRGEPAASGPFVAATGS